MKTCIIVEAVQNQIIPLIREDTGEMIQFDNQALAHSFADETCEYPHVVLAI